MGTVPLAEEALARQDTLRALYDLAIAGAGVTDPAEVARLAVEQTRTLLGAESAAVYRFEVSSGLLRRLSLAGTASLPASVLPDEGAVGHAFQSGQPLTVADYPHWRQGTSQGQTRRLGSIVAVPLVADGRSLGVLTAWSRRPGSFEQADGELLSMLAALVATMLRTAQLTVEANSKARLFEILHEVAVSAGGMLQPEALAGMVASRLAGLLGAQLVEVWWAEPGTNRLRRLAPDAPPAGPPLRGERLARTAYRTGRPAWAGAVSEGTAALAVPLQSGGRALGSLAVYRPADPRFEPEHVELLSRFAAQLAPGLAAAHLARDSDWRARTFAALHQVSVAASGVLEPARLARLAVEQACDLMDADSGGLVWWDGSSDRLRRVFDGARGWTMPDLLPSDSGAVGKAFTSRRPAVIADYARHRQAYAPALEAGIRSVAAVPLLVHDRAVGALVVRSRRPGRFSSEQMRVLTLLAAQVAPALESAELVADRERRARAEVALRELAVAAGGVLEPAHLAALVVEHAVALIGFDRVALYWWDHESGQLASLAASGPGGSRRLRPGQGVAGTAFQRAAPVLIEDYQGFTAATPWARRRGFESALAVPLLVNDRAVGAVAAYSLRRRHFSHEDASLLSLLAAQVAPAVEAARLHAGLALSEERFRSFYETLACGIVVINAKGLVTDANGAAEEILGLRFNQMRGRALRAICELEAETDGGEAPQQLALVSGKPVRDTVVRVGRRDGEVRWVRFDSVPVLGAQEQVAQVVSSLIDISGRRRAEAALAHQAMHDALTDLPNRTLLFDRLGQGIQLSQRGDHALALLMVDLDHFKEVNDSFNSHLVGDAVLREVAGRLRGQVRASDTVARLGGDEFAIVLMSVDGELGAVQAAGKVLAAFEEPFVVAGRSIEIGASVGIALYPVHGLDADTLMRRADSAMYEAKRSRGGLAVYQGDVPGLAIVT